jgi:2,5-furandicarboxylate decarboxylase 1
MHGKSETEPSPPVTTLRAWLDRLAARDRLAVIRPGAALRFELAAIAKHFEGRQAVLFPRPGGHKVPVVSGIVAARSWIAEAMGVGEATLLARFEAASTAPLPCRRVDSAPVQAVVHDRVDHVAVVDPRPAAQWRDVLG